MEQDLMEKLLTDFNGALRDINELIKNNDVDGVRQILEEISEIISEKNNIPLNDIEENGYDNVLHELLDKLDGVVEREVIAKGIDGVQGSRYYTNDEIDTEIGKAKEEIENLWNEFKDVIVNHGANGDRQNEILKKIEDANLKIKELEASKVPGQENSTYKYVDENLKTLQDEREKLVEEKIKNNDEISMLVNSTDSLDKIREKKISKLIDSLNVHSEEISNLENEIVNLKHRQEEAEQSLKNERQDSTFTKNVRADLEKIKQYLEENQNKLDELTNNPEIDFLKTFISNEDLTVGQAIVDLENSRIPLENEIANLKHRQEEAEQSLKNERRDSTFAKNVRADLEKIKQYLKENQNKLDEIDNKISKLKGISGISEIENETQQDNSERIATLEEKNDEIDRKVAEIDNKIRNIPGATPEKTTTERIDVKEEAQKIGDNLFKTAKIRRELYDRDISRDDFLRFYTAGMNETKNQLNELVKFKREIEKEVEIIGVDVNSDKSLFEQIEEAEQAENPNQKQITELYEKLRQNFISVGRREQLEEVGINHEISSKADIELMKSVVNVYRQKVNDSIDEINANTQDLRENVDIFSKEIDTINKEKATLEAIGKSKEEYRKSVENSIATRKELLKISMTPNKELTEEQRELLNRWQETSEKFLLRERTTKEFTYVDKNGEIKTINVETIDDTYPEYKEDVELLGIPDYKENLEKLNAYRQTQDPYVFGEEVGKTYEALEAQEKGMGEAWLAQEQVGKREKYVETFNGIPNFYKLRYENLKTAGSTLKSMKPVGKDLPLATRAKNSVENVGRFFGIRAPKFTKLDEHGNEVKDIKGGIATLAMDAAVIGAVVASAVTVGPGLAIAGYAAKGLVVAGNKVAARVVYNRHKDEIDNNLPTLSQTDAATREEARKSYYKEVEEKNKFVAWAKAKTDRYIRKKRGRETEETIVKRAQEEFEKNSLEKSERTEEDIDKLKANEEARIARTKQQVMSARTYNDIVRDPDAVNMDEAIKTIVNNATLNAEKHGRGNEDLNKGSNVERKEQYIKEDGTFTKTQELSGAALENVNGKVSAITDAQKNQAIKRKIDNSNRVATMILTTGIKTAMTALKGGFMTQEVEEHPAVTEQVEEKVYGTETITKLKGNKLSDLQFSDSGGVSEVYSGTAKSSNMIANEDIAAIAVQYKTEDGKTIVLSIAESGGKYSTKHVHSLVNNVNLEDCSYSEIVDLLRENDTSNFNEMIEAMGLEDCSNEEIMQAFIKEGTFNIQSSNKEGWRAALSSNVETVTNQIQTGTKIVTKVVQEAYTTTKNVFYPQKFAQTVAEAGLGGAIVGAINDIHEAIQTTYNNGHTPGSPKETMSPKMPKDQEMSPKGQEEKEAPQPENDKEDDPFTKIVEKKQKEVNKAREATQKQEEQDDVDR